MPYLIPRVYWYEIIVLNVHAPTKDESNDTKEIFYEELNHG